MSSLVSIDLLLIIVIVLIIEVYGGISSHTLWVTRGARGSGVWVQGSEICNPHPDP